MFMFELSDARMETLTLGAISMLGTEANQKSNLRQL